MWDKRVEVSRARICSIGRQGIALIGLFTALPAILGKLEAAVKGTLERAGLVELVPIYSH